MSARLRAAIAAGGLGVLREQSGGGKYSVRRAGERVSWVQWGEKAFGEAVSGQEGRGGCGGRAEGATPRSLIQPSPPFTGDKTGVQRQATCGDSATAPCAAF